MAVRKRVAVIFFSLYKINVSSFCFVHFINFRLGGIEEMVKATKNVPQIEIRKAGSKEFYFVFRLPSDGMFISIFFENISEVTAATESIQRHSKINDYYLLETTPPEQTHFIFRPKNKYPIGQSTMYKHESAMEHGLQYMIKYLLSAEIVDLTT